MSMRGLRAAIALAAGCGVCSSACLIPCPPSGQPEKVDTSLLGPWTCDPTEGKNPKLVVARNGENAYAVRFDMPYVRHLVPESSTYFTGPVISIAGAQFAVMQALEMTAVGAPRGSGRASPEPQYLLARVSREGAEGIRLRVVADRLLLPAPPDFAPLRPGEVRAVIETNIGSDDLYESGPGLACRRAGDSAAGGPVGEDVTKTRAAQEP